LDNAVVDRVLHGCALLHVVNGRVALIREGSKKLNLPGGKIEKDETPEQCIKREVIEETGQDLNDFVHWFDCASDSAMCHVFRSTSFKVAGCQMVALEDCDSQVEPYVLRTLEQYKCMMGQMGDCPEEIAGSRVYRRYRSLMKRLMKYESRDGKMVWGVHGADINALMDEIQKVLVMYSWLSHYMTMWGTKGDHFRVDISRPTWSFYVFKDDEQSAKTNEVKEVYRYRFDHEGIGAVVLSQGKGKNLQFLKTWTMMGRYNLEGEVVDEGSVCVNAVVIVSLKKVVMCVIAMPDAGVIQRIVRRIMKADARIGVITIQVMDSLP